MGPISRYRGLPKKSTRILRRRFATSLNATFLPRGRTISRRDASKSSLLKSLEKVPPWKRASSIRGEYLVISACLLSMQMSCR